MTAELRADGMIKAHSASIEAAGYTAGTPG
jgi:hypothetical protein